jgi:hypothetical protein
MSGTSNRALGRFAPRTGVLLLAIATACGDDLAKLPEPPELPESWDRLEPCPCDEGHTCCWDRCYAHDSGCVVEDTFGGLGGTLSAPNGTTLEVTQYVFTERVPIRMRSVQADTPAGVSPVASAVNFESPDAYGILTMPYAPARVPPDTDPANLLMHSALPGSKAFVRWPTAFTDQTIRAQIYKGNRIFVPAVSQPPCVPQLDCNDGCGQVEMTIDGNTYEVRCPGVGTQEEIDMGVPCHCIVNGSQTMEVLAACGSPKEVYMYECGFPCPDGPVPDGGPCN